MQDPEVGQLPPPFLQVEAVADEELVGHDEADVAHRDVLHETPVRPVEEGDGVDGARPPELERPHEVVQRQPRVDDVLDHEHVTVEDVQVEVLQQLDLQRAARVGPAVGGELDEVDPVQDVDRAREVGREDDARLQRSDKERLATGVVARDLRPELADPGRDLLGREVDLAEPGVAVQEARSSRNLCASLSMSRL